MTLRETERQRERKRDRGRKRDIETERQSDRVTKIYIQTYLLLSVSSSSSSPPSWAVGSRQSRRIRLQIHRTTGSLVGQYISLIYMSIIYSLKSLAQYANRPFHRRSFRLLLTSAVNDIVSEGKGVALKTLRNRLNPEQLF